MIELILAIIVAPIAIMVVGAVTTLVLDTALVIIKSLKVISNLGEK